MGGMNHCPPSWVKKSKVHQNGAHYSVCTFHIFQELVSKDDLNPYSVGIKPNFIAVPYLSGSWLDTIEIRRDDIFLQDRLIVIIIIT